jgi:hypothetical protein
MKTAADSSPSRTRSAARCYLCLRNEMKPMCPGCTPIVRERATGFEPATTCLGSRNSTTELHPQRDARTSPACHGRQARAHTIGSRRSRHDLSEWLPHNVPHPHAPPYSMTTARRRTRSTFIAPSTSNTTSMKRLRNGPTPWLQGRRMTTSLKPRFSGNLQIESRNPVPERGFLVCELAS